MTLSAPATLHWLDRPAVGVAAVGLSAIFFGLVPFFARSLTEAGIAAPAIAFSRYVFAAVVFLPFLRLRGAAGRASMWGYGAGFLVGLGWVGYVRALDMMPVAAAGVLYMTYPMFTLAIGWLFFRERPGPLAVAGAGLIILAALLAARSSGGSAPITLTAVALGLAAPLGFGLSINVLAHKLGALAPVSRMGIFALGSATGLVPLILTYPVAQVLPRDPQLWGLVLALGVFSALLPQFLYSTFVPRIGGPKAAALGAIELPTMFAVGFFAFGEALGLRELAAGAMVLTAILLTPTRDAARARRQGANPPGRA